MTEPRWRLVERKYCFHVRCERARAHITIVYGESEFNIPDFGTKEQARADAATIVKALNERDGVLVGSQQPQENAND
jgi:hypothetical protein